MKAEELKLEELVEFSEGNINFYGRRLILHSLNAFAQFRKDLLEMFGEEHARRILTRFGYFWGQADAAAMKRILDWESPLEIIKAGAKLHMLHGTAKTVTRKIDYDSERGTFFMEVDWIDSAEADEHLIELGWSDKPVCWSMTGYASGYASLCTGRSIYFVEKECRATGKKHCTVVGKDRESWGKEIEPYLKFFEAEDIKGTVRKLTEELREKMKELSIQRRELEEIQRARAPFFLEYRSRSLKQVLDLADRVAHFDSSVLITGETGVGKEVLANYIHGNSFRNKGPFITVNCGALPESLLESELFGHKAGSFTGAIRDRIGLFEQAGGGTIFLDEIGDITPAMQLNILRVLQEKEILRIGENKPRKIDVRVIAATNKDLDKEVASGRFREDLLYRLRVIEVEVPPLRERKEDILPLARYMVKRMADRLNIPKLRLDSTVIDYLTGYPWPGNVREMENALERGAILSRDGQIIPEHLPSSITRSQAARHAAGIVGGKTLLDMEREYIQAVLESCGGNKSRAAEILGISYSTLWRKLKEIEERK